MASKAIEDLVILLGETFRQSVSRATIEAYAVGLEGMTDSQVLIAGKRAIQTCRFMPTPAELRDLVGAGMAGRSMVAWGDVQRAISLGPYKHVDFEDPLVNGAIRLLGGWPTMFDRMGTAEGEKWYRLEFLKTYDSICNSGVDGESCRPLPGLIESQVVNGMVSLPVPIPIRCDVNRRQQSLSVVRGAIAAPAAVNRSMVPRVEFKRA